MNGYVVERSFDGFVLKNVVFEGIFKDLYQQAADGHVSVDTEQVFGKVDVFIGQRIVKFDNFDAVERSVDKVVSDDFVIEFVVVKRVLDKVAYYLADVQLAVDHH